MSIYSNFNTDGSSSIELSFLTDVSEVEFGDFDCGTSFISTLYHIPLIHNPLGCSYCTKFQKEMVAKMDSRLFGSLVTVV